MDKSITTAIESGVEQLGVKLPDNAITKLSQFIDLLQQWNKAYNLTAIREPADMVGLHLLDSLAVLEHLANGSVLDVGAGAGLPGIPLALARPQQAFTLIDTNGKKTRFMTQAKIALGLDNVNVVHSRVEEYQPDCLPKIIIARAYASTDDILATTRHLHHSASRIMVMQGKLDTSLSVKHYELTSQHRLQVPGVDADRHLLEIRTRDVTAS